MVTDVYLLKCLTNLHMGSGDVNYNVVDLEVERDPVLGEPTMNATGVKGALRDACEAAQGKEKANQIFGSTDGQGSHRFFSGDLLGRAVRVSEGKAAYALATTREMVELFLEKISMLGCGDLFPASDLPAKDGVTGNSDIKAVEGISVEQGTSGLLTALLGDNWVLLPADRLRNLDLPVQAHNVLENGKSTNLWYEEYVPHESVFGLLIQRPEDGDTLEKLLCSQHPVVQFGAGATTGNGFIRMQRVGADHE